MNNKLKYDWKEIQDFYDQGHTFVEITAKFGVTNASISKSRKAGRFKARNSSESQKLSQKRNPRKHSEETKGKISVSRKRFIEENPDKAPYVLNHYSKGDSYPEKYFLECLKDTNFVKKFRLNTYELDFAELKSKIDLEIDGSQHKDDPRIVKSDLRRNQFLLERGWKVIRIDWKIFKRKEKEEKTKIVESIISLTPFECDAVALFGFGNK